MIVKLVDKGPLRALLAHHGVLLGRQHLFEQGTQLRFAKHATRFDVGQQVLEVAHALRQRMHLAQALVHLLQPLGYLRETLRQALL